MLCRWRWIVVCCVVQHSTLKPASNTKQTVRLLIVIYFRELFMSTRVVAASISVNPWIGWVGLVNCHPDINDYLLSMLECMHINHQNRRKHRLHHSFSIVILLEDIRLSCTMTQLKGGKRDRIIDLTDSLTFVALCHEASTEYRVAL